jgi:hypothetical protein
MLNNLGLYPLRCKFVDYPLTLPLIKYFILLRSYADLPMLLLAQLTHPSSFILTHE